MGICIAALAVMYRLNQVLVFLRCVKLVICTFWDRKDRQMLEMRPEQVRFMGYVYCVQQGAHIAAE